MKKFTALMLVVLMVVSLIPFGASAATTWTEVDTVAELAAMADGNYWLTADIDLSKATWTTLKEFKGTLNGNGHTITLPKDAPLFDKLSGTVKNVNFKGTVALNGEDASDYCIYHDVNGYPVGAIANVAWGATIDNVHVDATVTFENVGRKKADDKAGKNIGKDAGYSVGVIAGFAVGAHTFENVTEGEGEAAKTVTKAKVTKETNITNVSVAGKFTVKYMAAEGVTAHNRDNAGTIIGSTWGNVNVKTALVTADVAFDSSNGNRGGIVGHINQRYVAPQTDKTKDGAFTEDYDSGVVLEKCLFAGKLNDTNFKGERAGGIVGYVRGVHILNCAVTASEFVGNTDKNDRLLAIVGYANAGNDLFSNIVEGCMSTASEPDLLRLRKTGTKSNSFIKNNIVIEGQTLNIASYEKDKGFTEDEWKSYTSGTKTVADAAAAIAEMAKVSGYKVEGGKLVLEMPAFTPSKNPSEVPAPTGDMTIALVAVAVVSLAAVTVIAKKKVND